MAVSCRFYSWDVVRVVEILRQRYIVISYKDNDFIPSTDIYSKVKINMAIYVRRHFSFRRNDYMGEVGKNFTGMTIRAR
jgi:hypothetical protein